MRSTFKRAMRRTRYGLLACGFLSALMMAAASTAAAAAAAESDAAAQDMPHLEIEAAVQTLLDEFTRQRAVFEGDKRQLFTLVDSVASPLFDLPRIAKLVLASHWKKASEPQRAAFAQEFKKLLIGTYATALFQYTGKERMTFLSSEIAERRGRKTAKVLSELSLGSGAAPIAVEYALLLNAQRRWQIYNLTISGLNMITNYRNTYGAAIDNSGLDGLLESMQKTNAKIW